MKEALKYILPVVIAILIFLFLKFGIKREYKFEEISINKYVTLNQSTNKTVIYVTSNICEASKTTTPLLKKVYEGSKRKIYMLNLTGLSDEEKRDFIEANAITKASGTYSTPMLLVIENKIVVDSIVGIFTEDELISFILRNNIR